MKTEGRNAVIELLKTNKNIDKILIEKGADMNKMDHHGRTALVLSIYYCQPEMAKLFIENGADVNKVKEEEPTALKIAQVNWSKYKSFKQVIELLEEKTAKKISVVANPIVKHEVKIFKNQMGSINHQNDGN